MIIYDISPDILSAKLYGSDTPPRLEKVCDMSSGDEYNLSDITMCLHTGAHVDAPLHFIENGEPADKLPLEKFIGKCTVACVKGPVTDQWIKENMPCDCKKLLIKCGGNGYLTDSAVYELCRFNLDLVGIDALSVGGEENEAKVHCGLMYKGIAILEGIDLSNVEDGDYFLFAAPIKIGDAEAAPCRALLIKDLTDSV